MAEEAQDVRWTRCWWWCRTTASPQDGMLRHFGAVTEATPLPIIVYNIPGRTGANMLPATLLELARRYPNIAGVKNSSGDLAQMPRSCAIGPRGSALVR